MRIVYVAILVALSANVAWTQTLASGAVVCKTKDGIKSYKSALDSGDEKKQNDLIESGICYRVEEKPSIAVTNACGNETRKILLNGEPVWCLSRHIK
ncbi:MAG: hypothetical protein HY896_07820 [Deltaproteobacteria bacterium]|nr:hypothetical protein [Deltaproteobacteria bacterium]